MITNELKTRLTDFAEQVEKYYGRKLKITESISTDKENFDRHFTTSGHFQLHLESVNWRISGGRMIFNGVESYYEIAIDLLLDFREKGADCFEFMETYHGVVFRKTIVEFENS